VNNERTKDPPRGLNGGKPAAVNATVPTRRDGSRQPLLHVTAVQPEEGDRLCFGTAGGGGWGDPRERDRREIENDIASGYISPEAAARDYGYQAAREPTAK